MHLDPMLSTSDRLQKVLEKAMAIASSMNERSNINVSCKVGVQCTCIANDAILLNTSPEDIGCNESKA